MWEMLQKRSADQAIENFNDSLQTLTFEIGQTQLKPGDYLPPQLNPPITSLIIYYPISRYDEFNPIPIQYNIPTGIRPIDILGAISTFYNQPLAENNIRAYVQKDNDLYSELYEDLLAGQPVKLKDAMIGRVFVESLIPYENGYELFLGS